MEKHSQKVTKVTKKRECSARNEVPLPKAPVYLVLQILKCFPMIHFQFIVLERGMI